MHRPRALTEKQQQQQYLIKRKVCTLQVYIAHHLLFHVTLLSIITFLLAKVLPFLFSEPNTWLLMRNFIG